MNLNQNTPFGYKKRMLLSIRNLTHLLKMYFAELSTCTQIYIYPLKLPCDLKVMGNNAQISNPTSGLLDKFLFPIGRVKMHLFRFVSLMSYGSVTRELKERYKCKLYHLEHIQRACPALGNRRKTVRFIPIMLISNCPHYHLFE